MSYNVTGNSRTPSRRSECSLSNRSGGVSVASTPKASKEDVSSDKPPLENGFEMKNNSATTPLIIIDNENQVESTA